jgi:hypothetical protein
MLWYDWDDGYLLKVEGKTAFGCSPLGETIDQDGMDVTVQDRILYRPFSQESAVELQDRDGNCVTITGLDWVYLTVKNRWAPALMRDGRLSVDPRFSEAHPPQLGSDASFLRRRRLDAIASHRPGAFKYIDEFRGTPEDFEDFLDDLDVY